MNEFLHVVISSHQFFFGLVACSFCFFLVVDLYDLKERSLRKREFIALILSIVSVGVFFTLLSEWKERGFFFAFEFTVLVVASVIHPKYAVGFLVYLLLSRPWESYDDQMMGSMPRDVSILTILSLCFHKYIKRELYFRFNAGTFILLCFSGWIFLSAFFCAHADRALYQYQEIFSKGVILFLLIQNGIEKKEAILPLKTVFVLAILEKCFVSYYKSNIMEVPTILANENERLESVGILSNSNDIAAIFVLAIPFAIFFILRLKIKPFNWLISILVLAAMIVLVWQAQSRGALLGIFAIFGAFTLVKIKSKKLLIPAIICGVCATLAAFSFMQRDATDVDGSTNNRLIYWQAGLNMAIRNPIFGVGFWGFPRNLPDYANGADFGSDGEHMTAHSSWVLVLGEGGFLALLLFLALWIYGGFAAWKIRKDEPEYFLGIAGYGMAISFLSHTYLLYPYILLSLAITHYHIEKDLQLAEV